jgi:hypothetical protein
MPKKLTQEEFIVKALLIHKDAYNYDDVIYQRSDIKVSIFCKIHLKFFLQAPAHHLIGQGCPDCRYIKSAEKNRISKDEFIKKAIEKHGDRYCYDLVDYKGTDEDVIIICPDHVEFSQTPHHHLSSNSGCQKCAGVYVPTTDEFIKKAIQKHGNKYCYDLVDYKNNTTKIKIICPVHGEFLQNPKVHLKGGCRKCTGCNLSTTNEFIKKAIQKHGNLYLYDNVVYKNSKTKVDIICKIHGSFPQSPDMHLSKTGCPRCAPTYKQHKWLDSLGIPDDPQHREVPIKIGKKKFKLDGYDPETNTAYEFNGNPWHGNPAMFNPNDIFTKTKTTYGELYNKTIEKEKALKDSGYNIISIWESDFDKINKP